MPHPSWQFTCDVSLTSYADLIWTTPDIAGVLVLRFFARIVTYPYNTKGPVNKYTTSSNILVLLHSDLKGSESTVTTYNLVSVNRERTNSFQLVTLKIIYSISLIIMQVMHLLNPPHHITFTL